MKKISRLLSQNRAPVVISLVALATALATVFFSLIIRGYRPKLGNQQFLVGTGLLSATSNPDSASVYLDDRLVTATDDTLSLPPNTYQLKIVKDGYLPWGKEITIKKEVVFQTNAHLFRAVPDLSPLTLSGAIHPAASPDQTKIVYAVASASASTDNGLYLLEHGANPPLPNRPNLKQLAPNLANLDWSKARFTFSPDSKEILAFFPKDESLLEPIFSPAWLKNINQAYLVDLNQSIALKQPTDITLSLPVLAQKWQNLQNLSQASRLLKLPKEIAPFFASDSAQITLWSPDEKKIAYIPLKNFTLPEKIITPPPAQSTQPQQREVKSNQLYVYDLTDDTNFLLSDHLETLGPNPQYSLINNQPWLLYWLPTNDHLIYLSENQVKVVEYDNTNQHSLFSGNFDPQAVFLSPDGQKLITLTTLYSQTPNLYAISIH